MINAFLYLMDFSDFNAIRLKLASPERILEWSYGEVTKPETINYRTQKPEKDGLFSESIFGPEKDFHCYCGKYKKARYQGVICDRCGVEVTRSIVRRERMGHIKLAAPVAHIWFLKKQPSVMGRFFNLSVAELEKVIYFAAYIITRVDEQAKQQARSQLQKDYKNAIKSQGLEADPATMKAADLKKRQRVEASFSQSKQLLEKIQVGAVLSELEYAQAAQLFPNVFEVGIGAEALRRLAAQVDLEAEKQKLEQALEKAAPGARQKLLYRLRLIKGFLASGVRPEWMFLQVLPVIPPDLRPMVQLDGGRFASSDVNDLYRRVINRNNRLRRLKELKAPEVILRNEKRMLQEAVDALLDNAARRGKEVMASSAQRRPLKSLADMLRGKQGRFRRNLLGKRVDYSGRSVIVAGPELRLHECGLPKKMALEIFRPFVVAQLIKRGIAHNIRGANNLIDDRIPEVWDILEEVTEQHYVLLNRAPTLHRLGIQAFKPVLVEGLAIRLHPLVCPAFNADFDGDQMAVHLPLTLEAQKEAEDIMLAAKNFLKPATGKPIVNPTQDMVLGVYWLTDLEGDGSDNQPEQEPAAQDRSSNSGDGAQEKLKFFADENEAFLAHQAGYIGLRELIYIRQIQKLPDQKMVKTTVGRLLFNQALPDDFPYQNRTLGQKDLKKIVAHLIEHSEPEMIAAVLDRIKELGFHYATLSGTTWGMTDLILPEEKAEIIRRSEEKVARLEKDLAEGLLSEEEKREKVLAVWHEAKRQIADLVHKTLKRSPSIYAIFNSGARGNWSQATQMSGMKGLVVNPRGEEIELPVKSSFKEGFNVLEYFISTHGARKGTTDTALKTAVAGYLTRRLVDVAHDVIVREKDCGTKEGLTFYRADAEETGQEFEDRLFGRTSLETLKDKEGKIIVKKGQIIDKEAAQKIVENPEIEKVKLRSPATCQTLGGICQACFGWDLGRNQPVELYEAVGIVAAQSIGEPGTQLTMRTFHIGGVAGEADITQGLPRVEELFEARTPKMKAATAPAAGQITKIEQEGYVHWVYLKEQEAGQRKSKLHKIRIPTTYRLLVEVGDLVDKGAPLSEGALDLQELYESQGAESVQRYLLNELQKIYNAQGAEINDRFLEVIIRKMFSRVRVIEAGDTDLLPGKLVERDRFLAENARVKKIGGRPAEGRTRLLGITRVALTTESWLSAASFQETARALINAAVEGKLDELKGLKENVIIGRLIPAGTGATRPYESLRKALEAGKKEATVAQPSLSTLSPVSSG